jgi:uridine kinase
MPFGPTSAKVNNKVEGLHFVLFNDKDIEYLDITSPSGHRTYTRSVFFVLYKAAHDLFPDAMLRIENPVSNGYYCQLDLPGGVTPA